MLAAVRRHGQAKEKIKSKIKVATTLLYMGNYSLNI